MNLVSMSCTVKSSGIASEISCHSLFNSERLLSTDYCNLYLSMGGCLHSRTAQRSAALWRASALVLKRRSWSWPLLLLYDHVLLVCQCIHNISQYHLTVQVKIGCPTGCMHSLNLSPSAQTVQHPLVLYAEQLTMQLALPLRVAHCLYSESGLFWAK